MIQWSDRQFIDTDMVAMFWCLAVALDFLNDFYIRFRNLYPHFTPVDFSY